MTQRDQLSQAEFDLEEHDKPDWTRQVLVYIVPQASVLRYFIPFCLAMTKDSQKFAMSRVTYYEQPTCEPGEFKLQVRGTV